MYKVFFQGSKESQFSFNSQKARFAIHIAFCALTYSNIKSVHITPHGFFKPITFTIEDTSQGKLGMIQKLQNFMKGN